MIPLHGKSALLAGHYQWNGPLPLTEDATLPRAIAKNYGLISNDYKNIDNFAAIFRKKDQKVISEVPQFLLPKDLWHLGGGDIISISPKDYFTRVLYRVKSNQNSILLTERCNHYCLMCSQPPKDVNDSWLMEETKKLIKILPSSTKEIGFTGGEPTLYGDEFIELLKLVKSYLPNTAIHILTNGRAFSNIEFATKYASIGHSDMMLGIPIYSDDPTRHNYIVQSTNAFSETIRGILNLKSLNQKVEIRVVIHKQSAPRLLKICEFISRNLLFVDHVALMGLEVIGFTRANLDDLWIDQSEYKDELSKSVHLLKNYGLNVSIYNHQLCLINEDIKFAYRKSISDWKNEYANECIDCTRKDECGGFFTSGISYKYSPLLKPFR